MKIKVFPPIGCDFTKLDEKNWIEIPPGSTIKDLLKIIKCSKLKAKLMLISLNGERVKLDTELHEGDVVGFFALVSGG